jgi:hypothetical protein
MRAMIDPRLEHRSTIGAFGLRRGGHPRRQDELVGRVDQQAAAFTTANHASPNGTAAMPAGNRFYTVF